MINNGYLVLYTDTNIKDKQLHAALPKKSIGQKLVASTK